MTLSDQSEAFLDALEDDDPEELYEAAPVGYLSSRHDGTIVRVNETFLRWTGYRRDELVRVKRLQDLLAPGDRIYYETHVGPLLAMQGRVREIAAEIVCAGEVRLPVLMNAVVKHDDEGRVALVRTAVLDATERRKYEQELLAARRQAEEQEAKASALAQTLQSSFLPPTLIDVPGFTVGGAYRPAGDGSEVGGDFYDVFETGRDTWGVVLGDVMGKGAAAAVITALARYTVRAEALRSGRPSAVLGMLHRAMLRFHPDRFCTAVFLTLELVDGRSHATLAAGGHQLPVLVRASGEVERPGEWGSVIGMLPEPDFTDATVQLDSGDVLVLFSDGVPEGRRGDELYGEERLIELVRTMRADDVQTVADALVDDVLSHQGGRANDDMAVVALRAD